MAALQASNTFVNTFFVDYPCGPVALDAPRVTFSIEQISRIPIYRPREDGRLIWAVAACESSSDDWDRNRVSRVQTLRVNHSATLLRVQVKKRLALRARFHMLLLRSSMLGVEQRASAEESHTDHTFRGLGIFCGSSCCHL